MINLNDPAREAGFEERPRMTKGGLGPIAEGAAGRGAAAVTSERQVPGAR